MRTLAFSEALPTCINWKKVVVFLILSLFLSPLPRLLASEDLKAITRSQASKSESPPVVGDVYAVIVGVSKYSHPKVPALKVSCKDAEDFADFLKTQRKLFRNIHVELLLNEKATKREIEKQLFYKLRQAGKDDTVILFFSGHGADDVNTPGEFFFLTYDAEPDALEASALNLSRMKFMSRLDSKRVLLIADTCHAGGFSVQGVKSGEGSFEGFIRKFKESEGRVILSSCRSDEVSMEMPEVGNSIFTHNLLSGLRGAADLNRDGVVTLREAYEYMYEATKTASKGVQHPQLEGKLMGEFPLSYVHGKGQTLAVVTQPTGVDVYVRDQANFNFVNKTDERGRLLISDLPCSKQLFVMLKKDGWKDAILGPFILLEGDKYKELPLTKLEPAVAFLALKTSTPNVRVWQDNKELGITDDKGILMLDGIHVGIPQKYTFKKDGFIDTTAEIMIPVAHEGKIYTSALIELQKPGEKIKPGGQAAGALDTSKFAGEATVKKVDQPDGCLVIRKGASANAEKIGCAVVGEKLKMTGMRSPNNWIEISEPTKGWVYANNITAVNMPPFPAVQAGQPTTAVGQKIRPKRDDDDYDLDPETRREWRRSQRETGDQQMIGPQQQMYPQGGMPQMQQHPWGGGGYQQQMMPGGYHFR